MKDIGKGAVLDRFHVAACVGNGLEDVTIRNENLAGFDFCVVHEQESHVGGAIELQQFLRRELLKRAVSTLRDVAHQFQVHLTHLAQM